MILISPFAKKLQEDKPHPKNYPHWNRVIELLNDQELIQVGVEGEEQLLPDFRKNLPIVELEQLVKDCQTWITVDTFLQHLGWHVGKKGVAIFGQSDPNIFGHLENINLLKDRKYLREKQFWLWTQCQYIEECWVSPEEVVTAVRSLLK